MSLEQGTVQGQANPKRAHSGLILCQELEHGLGFVTITFFTFFPLPHDQAMTPLLSLLNCLESVLPPLCYTHATNALT